VSGNRLKVASSVLTPVAKPEPVVGHRNINTPMGSSMLPCIFDEPAPDIRVAVEIEALSRRVGVRRFRRARALGPTQPIPQQSDERRQGDAE
jgi:hypothetical protein